jgi:uncharacterized protein with HEPN domain
MDNNIKAWLYDILNAIIEIESFFNSSTKSLRNIKMIYGQSEPLKEI